MGREGIRQQSQYRHFDEGRVCERAVNDGYLAKIGGRSVVRAPARHLWSFRYTGRWCRVTVMRVLHGLKRLRSLMVHRTIRGRDAAMRMLAFPTQLRHSDRERKRLRAQNHPGCGEETTAKYSHRTRSARTLNSAA